ncbi:MAG: hypothetical protein HFF44_07695 [Lawsonibacter sp.]|nr:hypothetical protein [Lawsonibacter sp.]
MKQRRGKPSRLQWVMSLALILAGLFFALPVFPEEIRDNLPHLLVIPGFVVLLFLWRQKEKYDDLPLEEQRKLDLEDQDERNQMIYEKAAWRCWQGETVLLISSAILLIPLKNLWQLNYKVFNLILFLFWGRILIFEGVRWWMNRKY